MDQPPPPATEDPAAPMPSLAAGEALLRRVLPRYTPPLPEAAFARMARWMALIGEWNPRVRLVGDASPELLARRHLGESLYLRQLWPALDEECRHLVDIGSGAGFPGLALALAIPGLKTTLVESTQKKAKFLSLVVSELGLENQVAVIPQRLEETRPKAFGATPPDLYTCRALDRMETLPVRLDRQARPGAHLAFWVSSELATAWRVRFGQWRWQQPQRLPESDRRCLVLAVKPEVFHVEPRSS